MRLAWYRLGHAKYSQHFVTGDGRTMLRGVYVDDLVFLKWEELKGLEWEARKRRRGINA